VVASTQMTPAESACCQQMAGQCDMDMAAKHPCCQKIVQRRDDAELKDLSHFVPPTLTLHVVVPGWDLTTDIALPSFVIRQQLGDPPHSPPSPSIEILRI
jgi:hypothetical protein